MLYKFSEKNYEKLRRLEELREKHSVMQLNQRFETEEESMLSPQFRCLLESKEIVAELHKLLPETKGEIKNVW